MKRTLILMSAAGLLAACATPTYGPPPPPPPAAGPTGPTFSADDFAWSQQSGVAGIRGVIGYRGPLGAYSCRGATVALTPDTPYSRRRIMRLYGSVDRAAVPVSVVRSRQTGAPSDEFSRFVRTTRCSDDGTFSFDRLPPGSWFVIVAVRPASGEGEPVALVRRIQTGRAAQARQVVLQ